MTKILEGKAAKAFKSMAFPKFAATVDAKGIPNVIPLLSARMFDPETIAFVRFMVWKTRRNFEDNHKITFACTGPGGHTYLAKGEFKEWITSGPILEEFENEPLYRYNAYTGANMVGMVKVKEVMTFPGTGIVKPALLGAYASLSGRGSIRDRAQALSGNGGPMPWQVVEKFIRPHAVKFLGYVDKAGDPMAVPHQGLAADGSKYLVFPLPEGADHPLRSIGEGDQMAASVLALEPSAYQVKGTYEEGIEQKGKKLARIKVTEVFAASPPIPGKRIYPPENMSD